MLKFRVAFHIHSEGAHNSAPNTIAIEKFSRLVGTAAAPVLIDVRNEEVIAEDP